MHLLTIFEQFSNKSFVDQWFAEIKWPRGKIKCPVCNGQKIKNYNHPAMPYRCIKCRKPISLKFDTKIQRSCIPLHIWTATGAHDLINPAGISVTQLSHELKISQNSARSLLNQIRKLMVANRVPKEFETGKMFRLDLMYYMGKKFQNLTKFESSQKQADSTEFVVVCITEFSSDKIWVETLPKENLASISDTIEKILPADAIIFTDQSINDLGLKPKKYRLQKQIEYEDLEIARQKRVGQDLGNYIKSAGIELECGIKKVYHKMTIEQLDNYARVFAGRWNLRHLPLENQMRIIFSKVIRK